MTEARGVAQIIDADPAAAPDRRGDRIVQEGDEIAGLTFRRFSPGGRPPHPCPSLLVLATAADFRLARRLYGRRHGIPRLHLLWGTDLSHWGHQAREEPALRVAIGEGIARDLRRRGIFREPVLSLPIAFDPGPLPPVAAVRQPEPLLLGVRRPLLAAALEQALRGRGLSCRLERHPCSRSRLERAVARAPVVVDLGPESGPPDSPFPRLTAMALRTPLITTRHDPDDDLCHDGRNALVRDADVESLAEAVELLLGPEGDGLRARLLDGARSTVAQHQPALQRLRFAELLEDCPRHWQEACSAHGVAHAGEGSVA